jgi:hypothetical protein
MKKTIFSVAFTALIIVCIQGYMYAEEAGATPGEPYITYREGDINIDLNFLNPLDGGTLHPLELRLCIKYDKKVTIYDLVTGRKTSNTYPCQSTYTVRHSTKKIHYRYYNTHAYDKYMEGIKYRIIEHTTSIKSITIAALEDDIKHCFLGKYYRLEDVRTYNNYYGNWDVVIDVRYIGTDVIPSDLILALGLRANGVPIVEEEYTSLFYGYPVDQFLGFFLEVFPQITTTRLLWDTLQKIDYESGDMHSPDISRYDFQLKGLYFYYDVLKKTINFTFCVKVSLKVSFELNGYSGHAYLEVLRDDQSTYTINGMKLGSNIFVVSGTMYPALGDNGIIFELGDYNIQIPTYRTWTSNDFLALIRSIYDMFCAKEPLNTKLNRKIREGINKELPTEFKIGNDELLTLLEDIGTMLYNYLKEKLYNYCDDLDRRYTLSRQEFQARALNYVENLLNSYVPEVWLRDEIRNKLLSYVNYLLRLFVC